MTEQPEPVAVRSVYEKLVIPLGGTMTDKEFATDARVMIIGKCPISVLCSLNDVSAPQIDLATYRGIALPIHRIYLTTTTTSTDDLEILFSNELDVTMLGLGASVLLVDAVGASYDARDIVQLDLGTYTTNINNGATATVIASTATAGYNKITGILFADRNLTIYVDQSGDGTNFDEVTTQAYVASSNDGGFSVEVVGTHVQIRVGNASGGNTTTLRFDAFLSTGS